MSQILKTLTACNRRHFCTTLSNRASRNVVEELKTRSLIKVNGPEAQIFLQGLVTNDMRHLENDAGSMYAMFLNTKGRVLFDAIVYRPLETNTFLIDCDRTGVDTLQKHMDLFNLRKRVTIACIDDEYTVWASYNPLTDLDTKDVDTDRSVKTLEGKVVPCTTLHAPPPQNSLATKKFDGKSDLLVFRDPRMVQLGVRMLVPAKCNKLMPDLFGARGDLSFKWYRYRLGVGEGTTDIPPGNSFPLEANCDYLHGVSFHKGCYLGQELTARTHHTGVVRKRLMPLQFSREPSQESLSGAAAENIVAGSVRLGKFRGAEGDKGLALLRVDKAVELGEIEVGDGLCSVAKPVWWPPVAPKEIVNLENKSK